MKFKYTVRYLLFPMMCHFISARPNDTTSDFADLTKDQRKLLGASCEWHILLSWTVFKRACLP